MVKVGLKTLDTQQQMDESTLLDCSATELFMDTKFAKGNFISITKLEQPTVSWFIMLMALEIAEALLSIGPSSVSLLSGCL